MMQYGDSQSDNGVVPYGAKGFNKSTRTSKDRAKRLTSKRSRCYNRHRKVHK